MTYEEIVAKTKELVSDCDASKMNGHLAVQVNIIGEGEGAFYIELKDGKIYVEPYEYFDRDCAFNVSGGNFLKLAEGSLDAVFAFTTGKLKVEGSLEKALEFQEIVETVKKQKK